MIVRLCIALLCIILFPKMLSAENARADKIYAVDEVVIEGNKRIDGEALRLQLKKVRGDFTPDDISSDIKELYLTGFFDSVTAKIVREEKHTILKYVLIERPTVRKVFIKGNKEVSEKDLSTVISLDTKRFYDQNKIAAIIRSAVAFYQTKGFYDAQITSSIAAASDNQVDLTFEVQEGKKFKIEKVVFKGLSQVPESDLLDVIQTKRYKWWSSWLLGTGRLSKELLENDKNIVRQYFLDHGYLDATLSDPQIQKGEDAHLVIAFDVTEGKQYTVRAVSVRGDLLPDGAKATLEGISTSEGKLFNASEVRKDAFAITDKFSDLGYAFANVVPYTDVNKAQGTVALQFEVSKGELAYVDTIKIRGNAKTYENVVRRDIKLEEQELFSGTKLKRSKELLQRLGYFDEVSITPQPVPGQGNKVDLEVNVKEGSTGTFSIGAGYSTSDGALFTTKLAENNIFGTGRKAEINVDVGTQRNNIVFSLDDPRINDSYVAVGTDLYYTTREFSDFDRELKGGSLSAGYPLEEVFGQWWEDISASLKYEYQDITILDVDQKNAAPLVIASEGNTTSSSITPRLIHNTINNPLNPTKGSRQTLSFEIAGFGGEQDYYLLEAKNTTYYPLIESDFGDVTFSYRGVIGYGESKNNDPFPLFKRYFPGGVNSVRGYRARTLGPRDAAGNEYGGSKEFVNSFEILFPLITSAGIRGVLFYDIGEAFDDNQSIRLADLKRSYGAGVRWMSPIGPIRVEFGFPVDKREGDRSMIPMFTFGAPF